MAEIMVLDSKTIDQIGSGRSGGTPLQCGQGAGGKCL